MLADLADFAIGPDRRCFDGPRVSTFRQRPPLLHLVAHGVLEVLALRAEQPSFVAHAGEPVEQQDAGVGYTQVVIVDGYPVPWARCRAGSGNDRLRQADLHARGGQDFLLHFARAQQGGGQIGGGVPHLLRQCLDGPDCVATQPAIQDDFAGNSLGIGTATLGTEADVPALFE
ncbi:hypothetical protein D9M71_617570 [compost metagenome]